MNPYVQTVPTYGLGEGPHWSSSKGELLYVNIYGQTVHRYVPSINLHTTVRVAEGPVSLVVPVEGQEDKYVVSVGRSLFLMEWNGISSSPGSLTSLYTVETDHPANRFNDGKCDTQGRLWAGTMSGTGDTSGNLYKITNTVETVQRGIGTSNGLAWNSSNTLMYYNDTPTMKVDVFDFNSQQGTISNRRTVFNFLSAGESGAPDGMTIDSDGNLWVATWGGRQVIQINPETGRKIRSIPLPTSNITSIAFGGQNLDVMYVTSASDGLSDQEKLQQPAAGSLFQITNVGSRGASGGNNFRL